MLRTFVVFAYGLQHHKTSESAAGRAVPVLSAVALADHLVAVMLCAAQVRALRTSAALCTMLLSQWSSLPQEDQQTLSLGLDSAGQPLSSDMKLAIQFRLQKKRLLLQAVNAISKQIQVIFCVKRLLG